jgi:hypothetical protein
MAPEMHFRSHFLLFYRVGNFKFDQANFPCNERNADFVLSYWERAAFHHKAGHDLHRNGHWGAVGDLVTVHFSPV